MSLSGAHQCQYYARHQFDTGFALHQVSSIPFHHLRSLVSLIARQFSVRLTIPLGVILAVRRVTSFPQKYLDNAMMRES